MGWAEARVPMRQGVEVPADVLTFAKVAFEFAGQSLLPGCEDQHYTKVLKDQLVEARKRLSVESQQLLGR